MTQELISKEKLIARLKEMRMESMDYENEKRFLYQVGRNNAVDLLLVDVACGDMDAGGNPTDPTLGSIP